jgi:hypothetical protein
MSTSLSAHELFGRPVGTEATYLLDGSIQAHPHARRPGVSRYPLAAVALHERHRSRQRVIALGGITRRRARRTRHQEVLSGARTTG